MCTWIYLYVYNYIFSGKGKGVLQPFINDVARWLEPETVHKKLLVWEIPIVVAKTNATKQKEWDRASPCSPLTYSPRPGSGWDPQKEKQLGPAGTAQATSHQPMLQRIWGYPEAVWLPPNQIINSSRAGNTSFIVFLYPYGAGGKKKKIFELAAQPEAEECYPPPSPASLLPYNHKRKTFRNSF